YLNGRGIFGKAGLRRNRRRGRGFGDVTAVRRRDPRRASTAGFGDCAVARWRCRCSEFAVTLPSCVLGLGRLERLAEQLVHAWRADLALAEARQRPLGDG